MRSTGEPNGGTACCSIGSRGPREERSRVTLVGNDYVMSVDRLDRITPSGTVDRPNGSQDRLRDHAGYRRGGAVGRGGGARPGRRATSPYGGPHPRQPPTGPAPPPWPAGSARRKLAA